MSEWKILVPYSPHRGRKTEVLAAYKRGPDRVLGHGNMADLDSPGRWAWVWVVRGHGIPQAGESALGQNYRSLLGPMAAGHAHEAAENYAVLAALGQLDCQSVQG